MLITLASVPIPRDVHLPLPVDAALLQVLAVLSFLAHVLFVLLMVGGSVLTTIAEIIGLRRPDYDRLAHEIAKTITVNKSLAVVLGVAPLLVINVFYTIYFYSANALTGTAWIMIVPLVTAAFLLSYAHKYSWERLARAKGLHIGIGALATGLFLAIPLIFLSNINLMLFPNRWPEVRGWLSTLVLPNVLPRYLHFLLASLAVTALFLLAYLTRRGYPVEQIFQTWDRPTLRRGLYSLAFGATLGQFIAGPLLFFTLPSVGMGWWLVLVIVVGVTLAIIAMVLLWREIVGDGRVIGRRFMPVVVLLSLTVLCMGYGRHIYRENAVRSHRQLVAQKTADFRHASAAALFRDRAGIRQEQVPLGELVFKQVCSSCHALDRMVVGPSLKEVAGLYAGNPAGIVKWANNPMPQKRMAGPPMAPQRLGDQKLKAVAEYMLRLGSGEPVSQAASRPASSPSSGPSTTHPIGRGP